LTVFAGAEVGKGSGHRRSMKLERGPVIAAEFEDGYSHAGEPVLMADIIVGRDENVEPFALGGTQEIAAAQLVPASRKHAAPRHRQEQL